MLAALCLTTVLVHQSPAPPAEAWVRPALAAPVDRAEGDWINRLFPQEDLVLLFQVFGGLGLASAAGVVALIPAHVLLFGVLLVAAATATPALVLAAPVLMLGMVVLAQAVGAGVAVWLLSLMSDRFRARVYTPGLVRDGVRRLLDADTSRGAWPALVGMPWLTGFGGYLVGAALGVVAGLAVALPLVAASLVLLRAPLGNVPGVFALLGAVTLGTLVVAAAETLVAPVMAAVAHQLTREPVPQDVTTTSP